jgi:hypothetical protein
VTSSTKRSLVAVLGLTLVAAVVLGRFTAKHEALLGVDLLAFVYPPYAQAGTPPPRNLLDSDPVVCTFPREASMAASLRAGHGAPRWEPGLGAGEPVSLVNATAPDYPPWRLAYSFLPDWVAHGALVLAHLALAMAGTFLLARARGTSSHGALVAALVYGLSGHLSVWLELDLWTIAASWLPWALLGLELGTLEGTALAALALGASILGGHLQVAALGCLLAFVWNPRRALPALALALALGAPRLVPALSELHESAREPIPFEHYFEQTASVTPDRLRLLLVPDRDDPVAHVRLAHGPLEEQANAQELRFAPGAIALALALAALSLRKNRRLGVLALGVLLLAMPTPLAWPLWRLAPGFGSTTPTRILALFPLVVGLLAGSGLDLLRVHPRRVAIAIAFVATGVFADGVFGGGLGARPVLKPLGLALAGLAAVIVADGSSRAWMRIGAAVAVALVAFDLAEATARWNPSGPPDLLYPDVTALADARTLQKDGRILLDGLLADTDVLLPRGLRNAGSYGSSHPARFAHLVDALTPVGRPSRQWLTARTLPPAWRDALSVRAVLASPERGPAVPTGLVAAVVTNDVLLLQNPTAYPRARVFPARAVHVRPDEESALALARKIDPTKEFVIEGDTPRDGGPVSAAPAEILVDEPERVVVHALAREASFLVLMDTASSGWEATVDGKPTPVLHADVAFRAVALSPNLIEHEVVFTFAPPGHDVAILAAIAALAAIVAIFVRGARRR